MSKLRIKITTLDKNFEWEYFKEVSVEVSDYNEKEQEVFYTFKVPDHVYDKLLNTAPEYTVDRGFRKSIRSISIKHILDVYNGYCNEITSRMVLTTQTREKKIFVRFNHSDEHERCEWTGGYMGKRIKSAFQFFIGYKIMEPKGLHLNDDKPTMIARYYTLIRHKDRSPQTTTKQGDTNFKEGTDLQPLHMKGEEKSFESKYAILDWSQEGEEFLGGVQDKFRDLNQKLDAFLGDLDNTKLKFLMETNSLKMLNS